MFWRKRTWASEEEQSEKRGREEREGGEVCNQAEPVPFSFISHHRGNQPLPRSPLFPLPPSSLSFAWKEVIRECERGRNREREEEAQSPTPSCQRRSEETSSPICSAFQLPFLSLAHSLLFFATVFSLTKRFIFCMCLCVHVAGLRHAAFGLHIN